MKIEEEKKSVQVEEILPVNYEKGLADYLFDKIYSNKRGKYFKEFALDFSRLNLVSTEYKSLIKNPIL